MYRSVKLWSFYADLEESLGTLESAAAVYDRMLELRIATPQIILNYALMLQVRAAVAAAGQVLAAVVMGVYSCYMQKAQIWDMVAVPLAVVCKFSVVHNFRGAYYSTQVYIPYVSNPPYWN